LQSLAVLTIDEAVRRVAEALDAGPRRSETDMELLVTARDDDDFRGQIDALIEQQRVEFAAFKQKSLADLEASLRRGGHDVH
jgi:hypothetical protein